MTSGDVNMTYMTSY